MGVSEAVQKTNESLEILWIKLHSICNVNAILIWTHISSFNIVNQQFYTFSHEHAFN
jgi:hypothetical protein